MTSPHDLDFKLKNPMCSFCKYSYLKFFKTWCTIKNDCRGLCAKDCVNYEPEDLNTKKTD